MTHQAQYMSNHSLANVSLLVAVLFATTGAAAQTRTPTSPLDRPEAEPSAPAPSTDAPAPAAPLDQRPELRLTLPRADAVRVTEPIELARLLPEGVSTEAGLTPNDVVRRATEIGLAVRRAHARTDAADAGVQLARRGFVPRTTASFRYTRLSDYTPATIQQFNTPACLADIAGCQANPNAFLTEVVLQEPILDQYALNAHGLPRRHASRALGGAPRSSGRRGDRARRA
jgi:hypothetical protein